MVPDCTKSIEYKYSSFYAVTVAVIGSPLHVYGPFRSNSCLIFIPGNEVVATVIDMMM